MDSVLTATRRVLVIDDDPGYGRMAYRYLQTHGFEACQSATGMEGQARVLEFKPDLILLDIHLPDIDGIALHKALKIDPRTRDIPIILITAEVYLDSLLEAAVKGLQAEPVFFKGNADMLGLMVRIRETLENPCHNAESAQGAKVSDKTVLIVDDDDEYRTVIETGFAQAGFTARTAARGKEAISLARDLKPEAMILDFGLPDSTGLDVVRTLKNDPETSGILILLLTGNDAKGRAVTCLEDGADGYLVKGACPVDGVVAHARALLRVQQVPLTARLKVGPVILDMRSQKVFVAGEPGKKLTPKEFDLLALLMGRTPEIIGWEALGESVCDSPMLCAFKAKETVRVHLCHLKHKLGPKGAACLVTQKQQGLQFVLPTEQPPKAASDESIPQR